MPIQQIDNTRVTSSPKPTGSYTHYDPKAPKTWSYTRYGNNYRR